MYNMKPLRNILLVEDYEANLVAATATLDMFGYTYETARNGNEALEKFGLFTFDVILMDIHMPGLDGAHATKRIRDVEKKENLKSTPIVAMTADYASKYLDDWAEAGIEDLIPKPFHINYLKKILKKYCTQRAMA